MLYIASDHGGFNLKKTIIDYLKSCNIDCIDLGPYTLNPADDYPDFVLPVVQEVTKDLDSKAIVICRNGVGVSMVANKFRGIRATLSWCADHVKSARLDDNVNVLALPADYISDIAAKEIVKSWLETPFSKLPKHERRLAKQLELGQPIIDLLA